MLWRGWLLLVRYLEGELLEKCTKVAADGLCEPDA